MVPSRAEFETWLRVQTWISLVLFAVVLLARGSKFVFDVFEPDSIRIGRLVPVVVGLAVVLTVVFVWSASRLS